jgi:hypothetical protein
MPMEHKLIVTNNNNNNNNNNKTLYFMAAIKNHSIKTRKRKKVLQI